MLKDQLGTNVNGQDTRACGCAIKEKWNFRERNRYKDSHM